MRQLPGANRKSNMLVGSFRPGIGGGGGKDSTLCAERGDAPTAALVTGLPLAAMVRTRCTCCVGVGVDGRRIPASVTLVVPFVMAINNGSGGVARVAVAPK